jgi:hypothetical protein
MLRGIGIFSRPMSAANLLRRYFSEDTVNLNSSDADCCRVIFSFFVAQLDAFVKIRILQKRGLGECLLLALPAHIRPYGDRLLETMQDHVAGVLRYLFQLFQFLY